MKQSPSLSTLNTTRQPGETVQYLHVFVVIVKVLTVTAGAASRDNTSDSALLINHYMIHGF